MSDKAEVTGAEKLSETLKQFAVKFPELVAKGIHREGLALEEKAMQLVPVDTGRLRQSAYVREGSADGEKKERIGFGAEYALPVHEDLTAHHAVGQAKFLETPWNETKGGLQDRLARWVSGQVQAEVFK